MSKKKCTDGRRNNRPPKAHQFKPGQSGNPKGRPKDDDRMRRLSMDGFRSLIMNEAYKEVKITEDGRTKTVPKLYIMVSQLYSKAAKGDVPAARLAMKLMEAAASQNDEALRDWTLAWFEMLERKLRAERNPGSLEHLDAMYQYYMFKKNMRRVEGIERWPVEEGEPYDDADWHAFIKHHEFLKKNADHVVPWPLDYPSDDPGEETEKA